MPGRVDLFRHLQRARGGHGVGLAPRPNRGGPPHDWPTCPLRGFGLDHLPYGVFSSRRRPRHIGVAIGDSVLDSAASPRTRYTSPVAQRLPGLRPHGLGRRARAVTEWLIDESHRGTVERNLLPRDEVTLHLPVEVADYVDFYASQHHAENLGRMFRPDSPPLTPNWKHLPIGYHGRAGTVAVSGTPVVRPCGQRKAPTDDAPTFGPSQRLDIEAEVGFVVGTPSDAGHPCRWATSPITSSASAWSTTGPPATCSPGSTCLSAHSSASPSSPRSRRGWSPLPALQAARVTPPARDVPLLSYLDDTQAEPWGLDIRLEVRLNGDVVSRPPFDLMYWTRPSNWRT